MDELFKFLRSNSKITKKKHDQLKEFVDLEEYETDAIQMDAVNDCQGNISSHIFGENLVQTLSSFIQENKRKLLFILYKQAFTHLHFCKYFDIHSSFSIF